MNLTTQLEQLIINLDNLNQLLNPLLEPQFDLLPLIQNKTYNQLSAGLPNQPIIIKQDPANSLYQLWVTPQTGAECVIRSIQQVILLIDALTQPKENWEKNIAKLASKDFMNELCPVWEDFLQKIFPEGKNLIQSVEIYRIPQMISYLTTMQPTPFFPSNINAIAQHIVPINYFVSFAEMATDKSLKEKFNQTIEQFRNDLGLIQGTNQLNEITQFSELLASSFNWKNDLETEPFAGFKALKLLQKYNKQNNSIFGIPLSTNGHHVSLVVTKYKGIKRYYYLDSMNWVFNTNTPLLKNLLALLSLNNYDKLIFPTWYYHLLYRYNFDKYGRTLEGDDPDIGLSIIFFAFNDPEYVEDFDVKFNVFDTSLHYLAESLQAFSLPEYNAWKPYIHALLKLVEERADLKYKQQIEALKVITQYTLDSKTTAAYNYLLKVHGLSAIKKIIQNYNLPWDKPPDAEDLSYKLAAKIPTLFLILSMFEKNNIIVTDQEKSIICAGLDSSNNLIQKILIQFPDYSEIKKVQDFIPTLNNYQQVYRCKKD